MGEYLASARTETDGAILDALDGLLEVLTLEPVAAGVFRARNEPDRFGRVFGGQLIAQAVVASSATVPDRRPHSLHLCFARAGDHRADLDVEVESVRDGRSMATRRVTLAQTGHPLVTALTSFGPDSMSPVTAAAPPAIHDPETLPTLQDWARAAPTEVGAQAQRWVLRPPPIEIRIGEAPFSLGGAPAHGPRSHWMRLPRPVGDDPVLHIALLAYASDFLLLDAALRGYPREVSLTSLVGASLDHAMWIHRPVRFDRWHAYTQELVAVSGERALIRGAIQDDAGNLVASTTQEGLVRVLG
ncbi:acyl-CoA thioesterase [Nocardia takedensis]